MEVVEAESDSHALPISKFPTLRFMGDPKARPDNLVQCLQLALIQCGYGKNEGLTDNGIFDLRLVVVLKGIGLPMAKSGLGTASWKRLPEAVRTSFWNICQRNGFSFTRTR